MKHAPILLVGGSGLIGRWTARLLRAAHPQLPLLIGGRHLERAQATAAELGSAEGVAVDLQAADLGLGDRAVSAVAVLLKDDWLGALRFAQARRVPQLSISSGAFETLPEISTFARNPGASAVVLGSEWLAGAATLPVLHFARKFRRLDEVRVDALLDEQDSGGPEAMTDMQRQDELGSAALTRRDGKFYWRTGDALKTVIRAVDGTEISGVGFSPFDITAIADTTGAPNVLFNLAVGVSSTRRRGEPMSTEILITLRGESADGGPLVTRHAIVHPEGESPLTAHGVAMMLERLTGLDGKPAPAPGLYFPEQLLDADTYMQRLQAMGGLSLQLDAAP